MDWTIAEAQTLFREIEPIVKSHGFFLCIGRSVVTQSEGRDLDLVAVPMNTESNRERMLRAVAERTKTSVPGICHTGQNGIRVSLLYQSKMIDFFVVNPIGNNVESST